MSERGSNLCRVTHKQHCTKAYRPFLSTMPIYDPKGTHWARYTTTQHGPMPVKAAAGVKSANARAASSGASNYQFHKAVANPVAKSPRAGHEDGAHDPE